MPLFRALAKNMAPMTNADESPTNRLTLFWLNISLFTVSTLWHDRIGEMKLIEAIKPERHNWPAETCCCAQFIPHSLVVYLLRQVKTIVPAKWLAKGQIVHNLFQLKVTIYVIKLEYCMVYSICHIRYLVVCTL